MALTRSVLVSTPSDREVPVEYRMSDHPFKLRIGSSEYRLTYQELSKIISDADGEIRDYLGDYEDIDCHPNYDAKTDSIKGEEHV